MLETPKGGRMAVFIYPGNADEEDDGPVSLFSPTFLSAKAGADKRQSNRARSGKELAGSQQKWILSDGKYRLNPSYAPKHDISLGQAIALPPVVAAAAALAPEAAAIAAGAARFAKAGREIRIGENVRVAPFGNRTDHPIGRYPHYHRRGPAIDAQGNRPPGKGGGRHRPWESMSDHDKSFWDRF
jgi:hypothetical protein